MAVTYRTERRTVNLCDDCGDVGPYAETHALVAVMNGDMDHAAEVLRESTAMELSQLEDYGDMLAQAAAQARVR